MTTPVPGLARYLIEHEETRLGWGQVIGEISASHHWNLETVHSKLGRRGIVPTADGGSADLAFVACALRVIDYAHINRARASHLDRALRSDLSGDSILHWDAQANITGPLRQDDWLTYGSTAPITNPDAWWLFYDLARGLDAEIRSVRDYLDGRAVSVGRFALRGVRGTNAADMFAEFVQLGGNIAPIDIRIQPDSMERLVELLGGKALYGADALAPLRELLQNARDAVLLRRAWEQAEFKKSGEGRITVSVLPRDGETWLTVADDGAGMNRTVIVKHLISVASDFWHSVELHNDFANALSGGFKPIDSPK